jgi:hypothetical protein
MPPSLLHRTLLGTLVGAALFGLVPLVRLWLADGLVPGVGEPLAWFAFLGAVIGGLAGPLIGQAWRRLRARR